MMSGRAKLLADVLAFFLGARCQPRRESRRSRKSQLWPAAYPTELPPSLQNSPHQRSILLPLTRDAPSGLSALHAAKKLAMRSPHAVEEKDEGGPSLSARVSCGVLSLRACRVAWPPCEASATFGVKKCLFSPLNYKACHTHERAPTHVRLSELLVVQPTPRGARPPIQQRNHVSAMPFRGAVPVLLSDPAVMCGHRSGARD